MLHGTCVGEDAGARNRVFDQPMASTSCFSLPGFCSLGAFVTIETARKRLLIGDDRCRYYVESSGSLSVEKMVQVELG